MYREDGGSIFHKKICFYVPKYAALNPRRPYSCFSRYALFYFAYLMVLDFQFSMTHINYSTADRTKCRKIYCSHFVVLMFRQFNFRGI